MRFKKTTWPSLSPAKILHLNKLLFKSKILNHVPLHNPLCVLIFLISITIEFTRKCNSWGGKFCGFSELRYSDKITSPIKPLSSQWSAESTLVAVSLNWFQPKSTCPLKLFFSLQSTLQTELISIKKKKSQDLFSFSLSLSNFNVYNELFSKLITKIFIFDYVDNVRPSTY